MQTGDTITFGPYEWRVLDVQNNAALVITEEIIEQRAYHDKYVDITWADCEIRKYLNGEFCDRFRAAEQAGILPVVNQNPDNPWYGTTGGEDTQDRVFLLSLEEAVCRYFGDSGALLYNPRAKQRYWFERKDQHNYRRNAAFKGQAWWWWLRTPGRVNVKAVYIWGGGVGGHRGDMGGCVGIQGNNILKCNVGGPFHAFGDNKGGVRPALWLKL